MKGRIFLCALGFCVKAFFLSAKLTSERILSTRLLGQLLDARRVLKFIMFSSNTTLVEFVLRSLRASSLTKPFFTPAGWQLL